MTTLAADKNPPRYYEEDAFQEMGVVASDIIYEGSAVGENGAGYARPLTSGDRFIGFCVDKVDNSSGSAGAKKVRLARKGKIQLTVTGASAVTDEGSAVYATDDDTFTLTAGGTRIGHVVRWVTSTTCIVAFDADKQLIDGMAVELAANDSTVGALPILFTVAVAGGAAANEDITVAQKLRVIDAWAQHTGGAGEASDTIQVFNGANAISDAMDWSGVDNAVVRAASLDDAYTAIAKGGTLRVTTTDNDAGDDVGAGLVYVLAIPVA